MPKEKIKIVAISGSIRPDNYTLKALQLVLDELNKFDHVESVLIDPTNLHLPLPGEGEASAAVEIQKQVSSAVGVILSTPEYHGSYSSVIKLVIDNLGFPSALAGKPVALLGVASGQIGAIKALEHLRSVCSHVGAIALPAPVSVASVSRVFDEQGHCTDPKVEQRIRSVATGLLDYINNNICPRKTLEEMVREKS